MITTHQVRFAVLWLSIIVSSLVACSKREIELDEADPTMIKAITEKLIEASATSKSEKEVLWNPGDEIAVFSGELSGKFESTLKKKPSSAAVFRGDLGLEAWPEEMDIWAVYPYSEEASFDGETITTVLPSEQIARDGEFGKDMNLAIAHSNSSTLQFYNVGGGIRFSVTEEGIKKVIFEGLGGEIISGKVEIGFSEDGLPEIRKVISGSQFITILPPDGQETFQKDTWYYIVVIPGSLEHGYKMRFYKDSDYARKVSENSMKINRSFYRDLENADDGIEYEATTTHFPETKEEWIESITDTKGIIRTWDNLINSVSNIYDTEYLGREILLAENVAEVEVVDSTIIVKQTDGIKLCMLLEAYDSVYLKQSIAEAIEGTKDNIKAHTKSNFYANNSRGKALILLPWYSAWFGTEPINAYKSSLKAIGFNEYNIKVKKDWEAGYTAFYGDQLSGYEVVIIHTHAGFISPFGTCLVTGTKYNESYIDSYLSDRKSQGYVLCLPEVDNFGGFTTTAYLGMNSSFLNNAFFHNSWIHLSGCETMKRLDLADAFLDKGAGLVTGFTKKVLGPIEAEPATKRLCEYLIQGISSTEALQQIGKKWLVEKVNDKYNSYYLVDPHPKNLKVSEADSYRLLSWEQDKNAGSYSFELYLNGHKWHTTTEHSYKLYDAVPGEYSWYVIARLPLGGDVVATYRTDGEDFIVTEGGVAVNSISLDKTELELSVGKSAMLKETILPNNATNKSVTWACSNTFVATVSSTGEVKGIAKGNAIITVKTEDGGKTATCNVTVKESSAFDVVDLGLSVNWASSNIGATKPEESGTYYAWGETSGKTNFSWENYKWLDPSSYTLTKYCGDPEYGYNGYVDSKTKLDNADDVARTILGDGWRMPTRAEFEELFNPKNCTVVWEELNGVNVVKLTSLKNGKVLYLPAVGIYDEDTLYYSGTYGAYWTSTFSPDDPTNAFFFTFDSSTHNTDTGYRYRGCPVRAVKAK